MNQVREQRDRTLERVIWASAAFRHLRIFGSAVFGISASKGGGP